MILGQRFCQGVGGRRRSHQPEVVRGQRCGLLTGIRRYGIAVLHESNTTGLKFTREVHYAMGEAVCFETICIRSRND